MLLARDDTTTDERRCRQRDESLPGGLRERALRLLQTEIEFIDNPQFRRESAITVATSGPLQAGDLRLAQRDAGTLTALCSAPLLTQQQETELFRRMNLAKFQAHALRQRIDDARPSAALIERAEQLIDEATRVRNQLVQSNLRLVVSIAKRFAGSRYTLDELIDEGIFTLLRTVDKFDFDRGFRFSTYATRAIQRAMMRWVSRRREEDERFRATPEEKISSWLGEGPSGAYSQVHWERMQRSLQSLLAQLDDREQAIVQARFAMGDEGKVQTLSKLAERFGVCKERVRQLEKRAIHKLRDLAQHMPLDESEV